VKLQSPTPSVLLFSVAFCDYIVINWYSELVFFCVFIPLNNSSTDEAKYLRASLTVGNATRLASWVGGEGVMTYMEGTQVLPFTPPFGIPSRLSVMW
jgi:hypothetical protein